jgi:hypothetical protein
MKACTVCKQEANKVAKIKFAMLDGTEININICDKCANKIDENLFYIIVCRNCGAVIWMENIEKERVSIKVQDECFKCAEPAKASYIFPMI